MLKQRQTKDAICLTPTHLLGQLQPEPGSPLLPDATTYTAYTDGDGLTFTFPAGILTNSSYLTTDMLLEGRHLAIFQLTLQEGAHGPSFQLTYGLLNECSARLIVPLIITGQNYWRLARAGAWLKPVCSGERLDLRLVDRLTLTVLRKGDMPIRWCITPLLATLKEPANFCELVLPKGPLLDEFGQSTLYRWSGKTNNSLELAERLYKQLNEAEQQQWPDDFSRFGGWLDQRFAPKDYFHITNDGRRWWLVDPEGYAFWSSGVDCVRVDTAAAYTALENAFTWLPERESPYKEAYDYSEHDIPGISYLATNFIRVFGQDSWHKCWEKITLGQLHRFGFNTIGNWSKEDLGQKAGFPYVLPLALNYHHTPMIFRDFPDVFHPGFKVDAAAFAEQLRNTKNDQALIGYFLMNEPDWSFAGETPAAGMLFTTSECVTRLALATFLQECYGSDTLLSLAWGIDTTFGSVSRGEWRIQLTPQAKADLERFSKRMVECLFDTLSAACRLVDPHHLNLGARYYTTPPWWVLQAIQAVDVFSINCYQSRIPAETLEKISLYLNKPILIGEWHFGAIDAGLPAGGICLVRDQKARAQAIRFYLEDAAAAPWCIGAHYFMLYDESALGRFDGENWNIGFLDICNRPYDEPALAVRVSHEQLYKIAAGLVLPYNIPPVFLAPIFS